MTDDARDTGDLAHAPADQRLDVDGGEGSDATAAGHDTMRRFLRTLAPAAEQWLLRLVKGD